MITRLQLTLIWSHLNPKLLSFFLFSFCSTSLCLADTRGPVEQVQREYHLPAGDFPDVEHFKQVLGGYSIDKFEKLKPKMVQAVDDMLAHDIPELLKNLRNPYE
jgi:hypothetical protein